MKRIVSILLVLTVLMSMAGCVGTGDTVPTTAVQTTTVTTVTTSTVATDSTTTITSETTTAATTEETVRRTTSTTSKPTTVLKTTASKITAVTTAAATTLKPTAKVTTAATTAKVTTANTTKATTSAAADVTAIGAYMTKLINEERAAVGAAPLVHRTDLQRYADIRAEEITQVFSHTRPDGTECFSVFDTGHYWALGENIAMGQQTVEEVMNDWMNSPGHRRNILSEDFNGVIIGFVDYHWVQLFVNE